MSDRSNLQNAGPTRAQSARGFAAALEAHALDAHDTGMIAAEFERCAVALESQQSVVDEARALVYDGMSEAGWHRVRRAIEAMETAARAPATQRADICWMGWACDIPDRPLHVEDCADEATVWRHALGWPDEEEIAHAKARGARAFRVRIEEYR
jgi:hypothetical protein